MLRLVVSGGLHLDQQEPERLRVVREPPHAARDGTGPGTVRPVPGTPHVHDIGHGQERHEGNRTADGARHHAQEGPPGLDHRTEDENTAGQAGLEPGERCHMLVPLRHYLDTKPDPVAMVIRVELFTHKPSETNTNWHGMVIHARLCLRWLLSTGLVDE